MMVKFLQKLVGFRHLLLSGRFVWMQSESLYHQEINLIFIRKVRNSFRK